MTIQTEINNEEKIEEDDNFWFSVMNGYNFKEQIVLNLDYEDCKDIYDENYYDKYNNDILFIMCISDYINENLKAIMAFTLSYPLDEENDTKNNIFCIYIKYININKQKNRNIIYNIILPYFNTISKKKYNVEFIETKIKEYNEEINYILK